MNIAGTRYSKKFVKMIQGVKRNWGVVSAGMVLAYGRVPPGHAMRLLGIPTNLA